MAETFIDVKSASGGSSALSLGAFAANPAIGDVIVVAQAMFNGTSTPAAPTDSRVTTWNLEVSTTAAGSTRISVYWGICTSAGADTVTCHGTYSNIAAVAWLIRGLSTSPNNGDFVTLVQATGTHITVGPTVIAPVTDAIYLAFCSTESTSDAGTPSGWNTTGGANGFTAGMATAAKKLDWSANEDIDSAYFKATSVQTAAFPNAVSNVRAVGVILSFSLPKIAAPTSAAGPYASAQEISTLGGDAVTITGTGFGSFVTGVTIGGVAATSVVVVNATTITCVSPAHATGQVNVVVQGPEGDGTLVNGLTYSVRPFVTGVSPQFVFKPGGTSVTITGSGFVTGASVSFGGIAGTSVVVVNSTTITCNAPDGVVGTITITVANP
jgi:hypothetical protein